MAANALVRCCFHAYADSAYARHIDSGGNASSVYGTLRNYNQPIMSSNSIEKVEGWRRMSSQPATSGSTLTLNSTLQANIHQNGGDTLGSNPENSNSVEDISIYNGDENHKIWAGSTRDISTADREGNYGEYGGSTMRSTRSMRPRQVINAPPPPPPPLKEEKGKKNSKDKGKKKKAGSKEEMYQMMNGSLMRPGHSQGGMRSQSSMSGTMMKGGTMGYPNHIYSNGTILRPVPSQVMNGYPPPPPPPVMMVPTTLPHPRRMVAGTFSHRPGKSGGVMVPPRPHILPPNFVPMPPHPMYMQSGRKMSKHWPVAMEEPIYMPSTRPLSPVASYQPGHFPHEAYLMQQYATMDVKAKKKGKDSKGKKSSIPVLVNGERMDDDDDPESPFDAEIYRRKVKEGKKSSKNSTASQNGDHRHDDDDESPFDTGMYRNKKGSKSKKKKETNGDQEDDDENESPFNTGIYRRKGHLNERAFSYSIRQEHRSRSYGSLANLKFAPPPIVPNGGGPPGDGHYYGGSINKEEMKKEREIIQMMQDLELSGDELERSEVPPAVYQQARQRPPGKVRR